MDIAPGPTRIIAGLIALIAWAGLAVQFGASVEQVGSATGALWAMLRYFTVLTNLLVAVSFTGIALDSSRLRTPALIGGVTLAIMLVGIVYGLLLRGLLELSGGAELADLILHSITPVVVPLFWLMLAPKGGLRNRDPWLWAIFPLVYFGYALARGFADGVYAYPFMNVTRIGWPATIANALLMAAGFVIAGIAMIWLDRRLAPATAQKVRPRSPA
ncbi:MAG: Pr6Pr family membrane protein [Pseudomonadota bacterium]|nr:Pr6Pr family membrane protein [Pseudomonadota bacterium]